MSTDAYQAMYNTRDETQTYVGIVDLPSFSVVRGTLVLARQASGAGANLFPQTLAVNEDSIFVGAKAAFSLPNRNSLLWLGQPLAPYRGDASFLTLSKDLKTRRSWLTPGGGDVLYFDAKVAVVKSDSKPDFKKLSQAAHSLQVSGRIVKG